MLSSPIARNRKFSTKVYKDFAVRFDGNSYTTPPWVIGKQVTVKADQTTVSIYLNQKAVAIHPRSWERKKRIELPEHRDQVKKLQKRLWHDRQVAAFSSLGQPAVEYLKGLMQANQPIRKEDKTAFFCGLNSPTCLKNRPSISLTSIITVPAKNRKPRF